MNIPSIYSRSILVISIAALVGCASGRGSGSVSSGGGGDDGGGTVTTFATPTGQVVERKANVISATGTAISDTGTTLGEMNLPLVSAQTSGDVATVVENTGGIVTTLGDGIADGLGQMGLIENPVGTTVNVVDNVIAQTGVTVESVGTLVSNLGTDQLSVLAPVTTPVGSLVSNVGSAVVDLSTKLPSVIESTPIEQITQSLSSSIVPLTSTVTSLTHQIGGTTGLGRPVNNLLETIGGNVAGLGIGITDSNTPVVSNLGGVVTATGDTVSILGILLQPENDVGTNQGLASLLSPITGILGGKIGAIGNGSNDGLLAPVTSLVSGLTGNQGAGVLAPVTDVLGGLNGGGNGELLAPVTGLVGGLTGGSTGHVTAPVTNLVGGLTGNQTGSILTPVVVTVQTVVGGVVPTTGSGAGTNQSLLSPVTNLLGGVVATNR
ncbi:collagen-like triple helix repeat-containing protein [uncultured Oxalicibacterium sp.]|uniref:collagen-like triple helix repeat-containing protein n=1 Tax=uncultured Oxalicibacterium sp. TaxID=1168540 RepID=UPI0025ECFFAC|nr:collagen-like triple helix repeat-containing protein [uncultured Oxalicibacterium sp.]